MLCSCMKSPRVLAAPAPDPSGGEGVVTGVRLFDMNSQNQGIVHIIGPELGITQPGQTIVCGDSHTSTHGAFGTLTFGIGTSEVEHVLATQCLAQSRSKTLHRSAGTPWSCVTATRHSSARRHV